VPGPDGNGHHAARTVRQQAPPPLEVLQAQFELARDANQVKLAELDRQGLAMDPMSFVHARIDDLIDSIAMLGGPDGARWAVIARLRFEQHIAAQLAEVQQQATRAQLAGGAQFTPAMIAELARQTGLFRRA
jgi:hypothetical protein